jgi:hypothetical protein
VYFVSNDVRRHSLINQLSRCCPVTARPSGAAGNQKAAEGTGRSQTIFNMNIGGIVQLVRTPAGQAGGPQVRVPSLPPSLGPQTILTVQTRPFGSGALCRSLIQSMPIRGMLVPKYVIEREIPGALADPLVRISFAISAARSGPPGLRRERRIFWHQRLINSSLGWQSPTF